ncbi:hypothetical protein JXR93_11615 [bacterium]|nr:hypothetical protein [bacterium]
MSIYIYPKFDDRSIKNQELRESLKNISQNDIETSDNLNGTPLLKKRFDRFRVIFEEKIEDYNGDRFKIYFIKKIFSRDDETNYGAFNRNPLRWYEDNRDINPYSDEIKNWFLGIKREEEEDAKIKALPVEFNSWLEFEDTRIEKSTIYEMENWVKAISQKDLYMNNKETICRIISNIITDEIKGKIITNIGDYTLNNRDIKIIEHDGLSILYEILFNNKEKYLVLYGVSDKTQNSDDIFKILRNYIYEDENISQELLLKDAKKAYPDYILLDKKLWFKIEEDSQANLALSPEEEYLIKEAKFPLFINGQAGTGKSTMLFYLFAFFCKKATKLEGEPLFLTYNRKLLETAKTSVSLILKNNPNFEDTTIDVEKVESFFHPFQNYIIDKLLDNDGKEIFIKNNYVSFNKFRECYLGRAIDKRLNCNLPNKKNHSPELVWHIIRTYIKGYDYKDEFNIDSYKRINRRDKTVSDEIFLDVFNTIWPNWYRKFKDDFNLWDDQDLIHYVLQNELVKLEHPVIFCDESQDFTRIEIELLIKLSSFTKYNLSNQKSIPFSFAGDPYQTINPTGFRWASLKTIFNDKFKELNAKDIEIQFKSLTQNYRSKPSIIKFSNLIQGFRAKYLNIPELKPQSAWQKTFGIEPSIYIIDDNVSVQDLKGVADKTIILIPIDSDEYKEREFVENDLFLKGFINIPDDNSSPISNVMSASSSKGLEFDKIIVYKFGDSVPKSFDNIVNGSEISEADILELSHFFNKLYVAVSRARNFLFIIDTNTGYNRFWKYFENNNIISDLFENKDWNVSDISSIVRGEQAQIKYIEDEDPKKTAEELKSNGMYQSNSALLQRAANYYKIIDDLESALSCEAWSNWYREDWISAGDCFLKLKDTKKAMEAFWRGKSWINLKQSENILERELSKYMLNETELNTIVSNEILIDDFNKKFDSLESTWKSIGTKMESDFVSNPLKYMKNKYVPILNMLACKSFKKLFSIIAKIYFNQNDFISAVEYWDRFSSNHDDKDYYIAKLQISSKKEDKIFCLYKLKDYDKILDIYFPDENAQYISFGDTPIFIFESLLNNNFFEKALTFQQLSLKVRMKKIFDTYRGDKLIDYMPFIFNHIFINNSYSEDGFEIIRENLTNDIVNDYLSSEIGINKIVSNENWESILNFFIRDNQNKNRIKLDFIKNLTKEICKELSNNELNKFTYLFSILSQFESINKDFVRIQYIDILKTIANAQIFYLGKEQYSEDDKEDFINIRKIVSNLRKSHNFYTLISKREYAVAVERLRFWFKDLKQIYNDLITDKDVDRWAKKRYLYTLLREREFNNSKNVDVTEINLEIDKKLNAWGFSTDEIRDEPKFLQLKDVKIVVREYNYHPTPIFENDLLKIEGVEEKYIKVFERNKDRIKFFSFGYDFSINIKNLNLTIENQDSGESVNISVTKKHISGFDINQNGDIFELFEKSLSCIFEEERSIIFKFNNDTRKKIVIIFKNDL